MTKRAQRKRIANIQQIIFVFHYFGLVALVGLKWAGTEWRKTLELAARRGTSIRRLGASASARVFYFLLCPPATSTWAQEHEREYSLAAPLAPNSRQLTHQSRPFMRFGGGRPQAASRRIIFIVISIFSLAPVCPLAWGT